MDLEIKNLDFWYKSDKILENISVTVKKNQALIIQGINGAGKSTLIRCIIGENKIENEKIYFGQEDINNFTDWNKIGYVPQKISNSRFPVTVYEFLKAFAENHNENKVNETIKKFNIEKIKHKNINKLSGGQRKRVFIARALLNDIKMLILDEPVVAVDEENRNKIIGLLDMLRKDDISIIIITHNFNYFKNIATHIILLNKFIEFYGTVGEFENGIY